MKENQMGIDFPLVNLVMKEQSAKKTIDIGQSIKEKRTKNTKENKKSHKRKEND